MNDVAKATERLRRIISGEPEPEVYWDAKARNCDLFLIARAYLAEHPADDSEPLTEEWLRSVGFEPDGAHVALGGIQCYFLRGHADESRTLQVYLFAKKLPHVKTRGDVRHLAMALGIELATK